MEDDVISQAEAARILGVSRSRVEQMIDAGQLPAVERMEVARYLKRSDVEAFKATPRLPGRPRKAAPAPAGDTSGQAAG